MLYNCASQALGVELGSWRWAWTSDTRLGGSCWVGLPRRQCLKTPAVGSGLGRLLAAGCCCYRVEFSETLAEKLVQGSQAGALGWEEAQRAATGPGSDSPFATQGRCRSCMLVAAALRPADLGAHPRRLYVSTESLAAGTDKEPGSVGAFDHTKARLVRVRRKVGRSWCLLGNPVGCPPQA